MGSSSHKFSDSKQQITIETAFMKIVQVFFPHQATARIFRRHSGQSAFWPVGWLGAVGPGSPGEKSRVKTTTEICWWNQPGTLNNQFFMDLLVISNHFLYKDLVHPPIETTIYKQMFQVPARVHQQKERTLPETNSSPLKIRYPKTKNRH